MAISFVGAAENSDVNGADVTLTLPSMLADDLVIVANGIGDNSGTDQNLVMITTGYTEVADLFSNDNRDTNFGVFWKKMGATPDTTAQVEGFGNSAQGVAAVAMAFRGVDTTTPMDVTPTTATGIDTFNPNPPSIDHNNPSGVWTVIAVGSAHTATPFAYTTIPTGYDTNWTDIGADDDSNATAGIGYRTDPGDPENPGALVHSGSDAAGHSWAACTIALRPAAAGGGVSIPIAAYHYNHHLGSMAS